VLGLLLLLLLLLSQLPAAAPFGCCGRTGRGSSSGTGLSGLLLRLPRALLLLLLLVSPVLLASPAPLLLLLLLLLLSSARVQLRSSLIIA
jgi:hypothetical protein